MRNKPELNKESTNFSYSLLFKIKLFHLCYAPYGALRPLHILL